MIEKILNYIAPVYNLRRKQARIACEVLDSAYNSASYTSRALKTWIPSVQSPQTELSWATLRTLIARSRDAYRNQPLAKACIDRIVLNSIGMGLKLQSKIIEDILKIDSYKARELECDYSEKYNYQSFQACVLRELLLTGDAFINIIFEKRKSFYLKFQIIESDLVSNPNDNLDTEYIKSGIKLDKALREISYFVRQGYIDDITNKKAYVWKEIKAYPRSAQRRRLLHIALRTRVTAVRGTPILSSVLESMKQLDRYMEAELTASIVAGLLAIFVKTETDMGLPVVQNQETQQNQEIELGPGAVVNLAPNESIETLNPLRPNKGFSDYILANLKNIGAALGLPLEFLVMHFQASYSAARASLLQAWRVIEFYRAIISRELCQPIYEFFIDELIASGKLNLKGINLHAYQQALYNASWVGQTRGSIDELKDTNAAIQRIDANLSTIQLETEKLLGEDWYEILKQRELERKIAGQTKAKQSKPIEFEEE